MVQWRRFGPLDPLTVMAAISLDSTVAVGKNTVFRDMDGEAVILDLESGTYFGLNDVGTRMWQLMEQHGTPRAALGTLIEEFDVAPDVLEQDLITLASELAEKGLLEVA